VFRNVARDSGHRRGLSDDRSATAATLQKLVAHADCLSMRHINRVVGTLQRAAADPELRGPLVGVVRGDGEFDLRIPPAHIVRSPAALFCALGTGLREAEARAVGIVLPVRAVWDEDRLCEYADAEAVVLVAAEDVGNGVVSVGLRCPLHLLPEGWEEAHEKLQGVAAPLRQALAERPLQQEETF
jgi:hypothetical protein